MNKDIKDYILWLKIGNSDFNDYYKFFGRTLTENEIENKDNMIDEYAEEMSPKKLQKLATEWKNNNS